MKNDKLSFSIDDHILDANRNILNEMEVIVLENLAAHGIKIDWEEEELKRFKSLQWESREGIDYFYYNDGSIKGLLVAKIKREHTYKMT